MTDTVHEERLSYEEAVKYLYSLQKFGIKFGLSKTSNLLNAFGNPHERQNYVHIAGTNGKGSVAAFLASILREAGFRIGVYTSPHLLRFTERFRINGREMSRETAAQLINELRGVVVQEEPPTFFEATTAMALVYFAREKTDLAIMEVGMGGRLDATNIIRPLVSVITNISLEHQDFLGTSIKEIAGEKAGIIKEGVDLVTGARKPRVVKEFRRLCQEKKAPFWRIGEQVRYRLTPSGLHYYGLARRMKGIRLGLKGHFQARNAALALAAGELLERKGFPVSREQVRMGLRNVDWPGRMQVISTNPEILLDGAHNPGAARALASALQEEYRGRRVIMVIGVMDDKDIREILKWIVPLGDHIIYTRPQYYRAAAPERLMAEAASFEVPGEIVPALFPALDRARALAHPSDVIVVCGSLFTVGEALPYFDPEKYSAEE
ncbi:MAG: bifunctional folylpolyglutamate synthase/dihydrofolate synthase [Deltaproteobacteria bacterium]|nr:bifunctional folylpolyglutamate synthase/dihydrofolate synthase [Deltaproteobacteria bacterium]